MIIGRRAGAAITTSTNNVCVGLSAGGSNTSMTGGNNVFIGNVSGNNNTTGTQNTALGNEAGNANTTGQYNVFVGSRAGASNTTANDNIYIGQNAGQSNATGQSNIFLGRQSGNLINNGNDNTIVGNGSGTNLTTGTNNIILGKGAGSNSGFTSGSNNLIIGNAGPTSAISNSFWLPTGIDGTTGSTDKVMTYNPTSGRVSTNSYVYGFFISNVERFYIYNPRNETDYEGNKLTFTTTKAINISITDNKNITLQPGLYELSMRLSLADPNLSSISDIWIGILESTESSPIQNSTRIYNTKPYFDVIYYQYIYEITETKIISILTGGNSNTPMANGPWYGTPIINYGLSGSTEINANRSPYDLIIKKLM